MLSVLIPIYNYNVLELVTKLHSLLNAQQIPFEIICIDDASTVHFSENETLTALNHVSFESSSKNLGRSACRNLLAQKAQYDYLLFIDSDMQVISDDFIQKYIEQLPNYDLVYGGISYEEQAPNPKLLLRWKYGREREATDFETRNKDLYFSIKTCNVLIKKQVFDSIKFNENIAQYGHEDTLFSIELARKKIKVIHIHNPLLHLGIEDSELYLKKVEIACKSLAFIASNFLSEKEKNQFRLIYFHTKLSKMGLIWFIKRGYDLFEKRITKNLLSENPSLLLLDYYKLIAYDKVLSV